MKELYQLISGVIYLQIGSSTIVVEPFLLNDRYMAEILADEEYNRAFMDGNYTEQELLDLMIDCGLWGAQEEELEKIPQNIEQMKVDYYNNFYLSTTRNHILYNIKLQEKRLDELLSLKSSFLIGSCEQLKHQFKILYLIEKSSKINGESVDWNKHSLLKVANKYAKEIPTDVEIRNMAKDDRWRCLWAAGKHNTFGKPIIELTEQQVSLLNWSRIYDYVYESIDQPSEEIIQDNYALDGWFITQRRKREEERKQKGLDNKIKNTDAQEVFIHYKDNAELKDIYNMNNTEGKLRIKSIEQDLIKYGSLNEEQLSSTRKEIAMAHTRAAMERLRR